MNIIFIHGINQNEALDKKIQCSEIELMNNISKSFLTYFDFYKNYTLQSTCTS